MSTKRKKLSPEESIAKAEASLARAKAKAQEQERNAFWKKWHEVRNSLADFDDVIAEVEKEVAAKNFPGATSTCDGDDSSPAQRAFDIATADLGLDYRNEARLEAMAAGVKMAHETFAKYAREQLENAVATYLARPQAERDAEIDAEIDDELDRDAALKKRRAEAEADPIASDDGDDTPKPPTLRLVK
jgi:hypothetical protein